MTPRQAYQLLMKLRNALAVLETRCEQTETNRDTVAIWKFISDKRCEVNELCGIVKYETRHRMTTRQVRHMQEIRDSIQQVARQLPKSATPDLDDD